jgi:hypothetical protein
VPIFAFLRISAFINTVKCADVSVKRPLRAFLYIFILVKKQLPIVPTLEIRVVTRKNNIHYSGIAFFSFTPTFANVWDIPRAKNVPGDVRRVCSEFG